MNKAEYSNLLLMMCFDFGVTDINVRSNKWTANLVSYYRGRVLYKYGVDCCSYPLDDTFYFNGNGKDVFRAILSRLVHRGWQVERTMVVRL